MMYISLTLTFLLISTYKLYFPWSNITMSRIFQSHVFSSIAKYDWINSRYTKITTEYLYFPEWTMPPSLSTTQYPTPLYFILYYPVSYHNSPSPSSPYTSLSYHNTWHLWRFTRYSQTSLRHISIIFSFFYFFLYLVIMYRLPRLFSWLPR